MAKAAPATTADPVELVLMDQIASDAMRAFLEAITRVSDGVTSGSSGTSLRRTRCIVVTFAAGAGLTQQWTADARCKAILVGCLATGSVIYVAVNSSLSAAAFPSPSVNAPDALIFAIPSVAGMFECDYLIEVGTIVWFQSASSGSKCCLIVEYL